MKLRALEKNVELCIKDNGIGIPKELQERIFERFFAWIKVVVKKIGGSGLGFSIATISVKSDKGKE